jgi:hypothetical protein
MSMNINPRPIFDFKGNKLKGISKINANYPVEPSLKVITVQEGNNLFKLPRPKQTGMNTAEIRLMPGTKAVVDEKDCVRIGVAAADACVEMLHRPLTRSGVTDSAWIKGGTHFIVDENGVFRNFTVCNDTSLFKSDNELIPVPKDAVVECNSDGFVTKINGKPI